MPIPKDLETYQAYIRKQRESEDTLKKKSPSKDMYPGTRGKKGLYTDVAREVMDLDKLGKKAPEETRKRKVN